MFGGDIIIHYLCITLPVDNPDGGATRVGESGRVSAYIFFNISPPIGDHKQKIPTRYEPFGPE